MRLGLILGLTVCVAGGTAHADAKSDALEDLRKHIYFSYQWLKVLERLEPAEDGLAAIERIGAAERQLEDAVECARKVDKAIAAEVPPDQTMVVANGLKNHQKKTITVGEVKASICDPLKAAAETKIAAYEAVIEASLAPFRKALKGDKFEVWEDKFGLYAHAGSVGGGDLIEPEDYAGANVWFAGFTFDNAECASGKGWKLTRYEFDKKGKLKGTREQDGCGAEAPASAYK
jgi:hypothetical protein